MIGGKKIFNKLFVFILTRKIISMFIPSRVYIKVLYKKRIGRKLDLRKPTRYTEKLQWLKLNDHNPDYTKMVDKYEVKKYIAETIGEEYVIPTYGVWNSFDEIDFSKLPNQFVLKCTHDSGGLVICRNKQDFDFKNARKKISKCLKTNYYLKYREWPYKNVKPRIIAEQYMEDSDNSCLTDYKFFCFNGIPKIMYISKDKSENPGTDFFDMNYNHLELKMRDNNSKILPEKPLLFEKMKKISSVFANKIAHIRVDFYMINNHLYIGELTFYHMSGFQKITPDDWDYKLGNMLDISGVNNECK